ncbi:MAG: DNA repair protein [Atopobiaceae bacterium]|nr:DNA repair protein [Atopobiaceae bacterium]
MTRQRQYLCIDLKSFYASVECVERGLDPMTTRLVVADPSRTEKTICLAVSPALKALGVRNRCRVFEIPKGIDYLMAAPRMALYIQRSADIYEVYLRHVAPEDIHVYSIDEAFLDVTNYLTLYGCTARELGERIRGDVVATTGIPATCGLGPNLYLAKVALDITAKHSPGFFGELDEESYRAQLWAHRPLTDFWRVGEGTARRLAEMGIHTMGQLAMSPTEPIYQAFGIDAEILIDHAWGIEPVTIADIKGYRHKSHSLSAGQVLGSDYSFDGGLLIAKEMADQLALELVDSNQVARAVNLIVGYKHDRDDAFGSSRARRNHWGEYSTSGTRSFAAHTSSSETIRHEVEQLYREITEQDRPVHRITLALGDVVPADDEGLQMDLFSDPAKLERENRRLKAVNAVRQKFGKNAMLRAMDLLPEATARERNRQIGGHRSGEQ